MEAEDGAWLFSSYGHTFPSSNTHADIIKTMKTLLHAAELGSKLWLLFLPCTTNFLLQLLKNNRLVSLPHLLRFLFVTNSSLNTAHYVNILAMLHDTGLHSPPS